MVPATADLKLTVKFFGLTPGAEVEASYHISPPVGSGWSTGQGVEVVEGDGTVTFKPRLQTVTHGLSGNLRCWCRAQGTNQSDPPLPGLYGLCEVTIPVP